MSQRRMFSPKIVESDEFIAMPVSSQALYFHLGMNADDDGFIQPRQIMKAQGFAEDDLKVLVAKRFVLIFESGVIVIKHWLIHNLIQKDRHHPTRFISELSHLVIKQDRGYTERIKGQETPVNKLLTEVRLGKDRLLGEVETSQDDLEIEPTDDNGNPLPLKKKKDTSYRRVFELWGKDYPLNWRVNRTEIAAAKNILQEHSLEKAKNALDFYEENKDLPKCPQILKPSDLDRKWVNLQALRDKNG